MAAGDEFQGQLALAQTRFPADEHANAQHIHEDPVQGRAGCKGLAQLNAGEVDEPRCL